MHPETALTEEESSCSWSGPEQKRLQNDSDVTRMVSEEPAFRYISLQDVLVDSVSPHEFLMCTENEKRL